MSPHMYHGIAPHRSPATARKSGRLVSVADDEGCQRSVQIIEDALAEFRRSHDPRCLAADEIEKAITVVLDSVTAIQDRPELMWSRIAAVGAVAWLCWLRYGLGATEDRAGNLIIAVDMFGFIGAALSNVPPEVELFHAARRGAFEAFEGDYKAMN